MGFDTPNTSLEAAKNVAIEGGKQGAYELGGKIGGKIAGKAIGPLARKFAPQLEKAALKYPILQSLVPVEQSGKSLGHLTAAASEKGKRGPALKAIQGSIENIEGELQTASQSEDGTDIS